MRILHFADLHLGVETYGSIDPATGLSSRLDDFLAALDQVVEFAVSNDVDLVLFCGDAYKSREPSQTYQREFARRIKRLGANGVSIFLLVGNHDLPNAIGRATAVEIFDTLAVENVTVANRLQNYRIETRRGPLQIMALPWARRSALLSREESKNLSSEQLNQKLQEILTSHLAAGVKELDPDVPAILAGHLAHSGAIPGSERTMLISRDYTFMQSTIADPAFDYVALGHIHKSQILEQPVPVVYPGSLQSIDFGDEGQEKGFYVVQMDETAGRGHRLQSYDFHPVKTRRFLTVKVDADTENPMETILHAIAREDIADAIVRLHINVSAAKEALIQENEIRKALKEAYFIAAVYKDVERDQPRRLRQHSAEELTPLEALELYLETRKIPEDRVRILLEYGEKLIRGDRNGGY